MTDLAKIKTAIAIFKETIVPTIYTIRQMDENNDLFVINSNCDMQIHAKAWKELLPDEPLTYSESTKCYHGFKRLDGVMISVCASAEECQEYDIAVKKEEEQEDDF